MSSASSGLASDQCRRRLCSDLKMQTAGDAVTFEVK